MKVKYRRAAVLLTALVLLLVAGIGEVAAGNRVDLDQPCTIMVEFDTDTFQDLVGVDLVVDIYQIATARNLVGRDDYALEHLEGYDPYADIDFTKMDEDSLTWDNLAQDIARIALKGDYGQSKIHSGAPINELLPVDAGMYLIIARGVDMGEKYVTEFTREDGTKEIATLARTASGREFRFAPVLMCVPVWEPATDDDPDKSDPPETSDDGPKGEWNYNWSAYLKPQSAPTDDLITVRKVAAGTGVSLPGAKFDLYRALMPDEDPPNTDRYFTVYVEGVGEVTLYYFPATGPDADEEGHYVSDPDGNIELHQKKGTADYTLYALKEVAAPEGYDLMAEPVYFYFSELIGDFGMPVGGTRGISKTPPEAGLIFGESYKSDMKYLTVKNPYDYDVWLRVRALSHPDSMMNYLGENEDDSLWSAEYNGNDGYCYFKKVLPAGEVTEEALRILVPLEYNTVVIYEIERVEYDPEGLVIQASWDETARGENPGYKFQAEVITEDSDMTVPNSSRPSETIFLPASGGEGTSPLLIAGMAVILAAVILLPFLLKRQPKET